VINAHTKNSTNVVLRFMNGVTFLATLPLL
jgi:hypothetical protein